MSGLPPCECYPCYLASLPSSTLGPTYLFIFYPGRLTRYQNYPGWAERRDILCPTERQVWWSTVWRNDDRTGEPIGHIGGSESSAHQCYSPKDIQGNIHSALRLRLRNTAPPSRPLSGTYPFSFQTEWEDSITSPSAVVVWSGGANAVAAYKRSLEPMLMYVDVIYGEGNVASFSRPMTEDEVSTGS